MLGLAGVGLGLGSSCWVGGVWYGVRLGLRLRRRPNCWVAGGVRLGCGGEGEGTANARF